MILKDADTIFIEGKDVERIKILNDVVWEKIKATTLTLHSSTSSTSFVNSFTLTASLTETKTGMPVDGNIEFYDGNTKIGISTTLNGTATLTTSSNNIGTHNYKAKYVGTKKHKPSNSSMVAVAIQKDTPKLSVLGTTTNIYNGWDIGVKLVDSKGNPISNRTINFSSGGTSKTTSNGKAIKSISGRTVNSTMNVTFSFAGDNYYNAKSLQKAYKILQYKSQASSITNLSSVSGGPSSTSCSSCENTNNTQPYQKWDSINKNGESRCGRRDCYCYMIGTASGTWKRPAPLIATFTKISGTIQKITCSYSDKYDKGFHNGGYPSIKAPILTSNTYGSSKTSGNPNKASYSGHSVEWTGAKTMSSVPTIKFSYPANTAGETGIIYIKNIKLTVYYIPPKESL